MRNSTIVSRLKSIEQSLMDTGEYVERFDALSLSTVDIDTSNSNNNSVSGGNTLSLSGLTKLVTELTTVLHEAYIDQQTGSLSFIINHSHYCHHHYNYHCHYYHYHHYYHNYHHYYSTISNIKRSSTM